MKNSKIMQFAEPVEINYGLTPFDWAEEHLNFGRSENYETELKTPFSADYMPFLREPSEAILDQNVSECWIMKCSRAGVSENTILIPLRFMVARMKKPVLYVSGNQKSTEDFMETRIKRGFYLSEETEKEYEQSRTTEHRIIFRGMDLNIAWPSSTMAFKQSGYSTIFLDEVSTYKNAEIIDVIRKRTANWRHSTIVGVSSPATEITRPSSQDPIFIEYESGTQKIWTMTDVNGAEFDYRLSGIRWDKKAKNEKTGKWDMARVSETSHYKTPSGAIITDADRMRYVRDKLSFWKKTNPSAVKGRESYYVNAPMTPFKTGDFAHIAVRFLEAKSRGKKALRAFFYEYMPEPVEETNEASVSEGMIYEIQSKNVYGRKSIPFSDAVVITTIDTQDKMFVWSVWAMNESAHALIDHGYEITKDALEDRQANAEYITKSGKICKSVFSLIDTGGHRTHEVYALCAKNKKFIAIKGDNGQSTSSRHPIKLSDIDGLPLRLVHPEYFKDELSHALQGILAGIEIMFHSDIDADFVKQITGEILVTDENADRYGQHKTFWKKVRTNDFFDTAAYSFAARFLCKHLIARLGTEPAQKERVKYPESDERKPQTQKKEEIKTPSVKKNQHRRVRYS